MIDLARKKMIDSFMPAFDFNERHEIAAAAPTETVFAVLRRMDFSRSRLIRALFELRSLPAFFRGRRRNKQLAPLELDLPGLLKSGFVLLGEVPGQEIVLGLIGKFWTSTGCLQKIEAQRFGEFAAPGFAKAVWNFSLSPITEARTLLATETRVLCLDETSRRRFRIYWLFVRPFSGWIRMAALRCLQRQAEEEAARCAA